MTTKQEAAQFTPTNKKPTPVETMADLRFEVWRQTRSTRPVFISPAQEVLQAGEVVGTIAGSVSGE